ncbi:MAG: DUF5915 domain-containing protein, partial [Aquiluna sp.]
EQGIREGVRQALLPLWNSYYFFALYANAAGYEASPSHGSSQLLDRYIMAKSAELIEQMQEDLDNFDSFQASARLRDFAEVLTNWYIRRSRDRFWEGDKDAFDTLYTVLEAVLRAAAPLLPIISEEMWRGLTGGRSVHLTSWPDAGEFPRDARLVRDMDAIREAASVALSLRKAAGLRVRLPLSELTVAVSEPGSLSAYGDLLADELNVKKVTVVAATEEVAASFGLTKSLVVNARALGPRLGGAVQEVIKLAKSGDWSVDGESVRVGDHTLQAGEFDISMVASDDAAESSVGITQQGFVLLNTVVTEELAEEGVARDAVRHIQQARKDAGLDVSDRISLKVVADQATQSALLKHKDFVARETLAEEIEISIGAPAAALSVGDSGSIEIELAKK